MSFADDFVAAFQPWMTPALEDYHRTAGEMLQEVEWYVEDTEEGEDGWTVIFDIERTLYKDLRWLGQIIGETVPVGHPEALSREWINDKVNQRRGTIGAIVCATQRHLLNSRMVTYLERTSSLSAVGQDADALYVITYLDQTPNAYQTRRDLEDAVPGDIVLYYEVQGGQRWSNVLATTPTWNQVNSTYDSWDAVKTTNAVADGTTVTRPIPV